MTVSKDYFIHVSQIACYTFIVLVNIYHNCASHRNWYIILGYDPADLTVHPPPPELPRVGSFFRIGV